MSTHSIIKKSELEGLQRIDPEYYHPKYFHILDVLRDLNAVPISEVAKPIKRGFKPDNNKYFNYIEIAEVNISTGAVNAVKILGKEAPIRAQWIVKKDDVIISTVRPIRNAVVLVTEHEDNFVCSSGFAVLKPIKVSPEFLFTYLKTKPIVQLLDRKTSATMYPAISWLDILSTPIFLPDNRTKSFVIQRVQEAIRNLKQSESLYFQAEQMVSAELGLDIFDFSQLNYYRVPLSHAQRVNRIDPEHFQPKYDKLVQYLTNTRKAKPLGDIASYVKRGLQPTYVEGGEIVVVNSRHLGRYLLNMEATERTDFTFWQENERARLQKKDVLLYSTGAYVGRTNVWLEDQLGIASNHVTIIRKLRECNPIYLAVYLNSLPGLLQAGKWATGSGQREIYPEAISNFLIYLPSEKFQTKIADLVTQSYEAREKAKALLKEAKEEVEKMILG